LAAAALRRLLQKPEARMQLSRIGYFADFVGSFICAALLTLHALSRGDWVARGEWAAWLVIGLWMWTLLEYGIHRWVYHRVPYFIRLHDAHHRKPRAYIGAPPGIGIAAILGVIYLPLALANPMVASGLTTGVLLGYLGYQLVHHAAHFWRPARGGYLYRARLRHSQHHYHHELGNFGITTGFWDQAFGTDLHRRRVAYSSRRLAGTAKQCGPHR
jgi:sterol desaturase/sphingolipid hydroxylase (fatty acid hydroxylase superfamily)